jgi:hypothetical protein
MHVPLKMKGDASSTVINKTYISNLVYAQSQTIGKSNKLNVFGSTKPKSLNRIG